MVNKEFEKILAREFGTGNKYKPAASKKGGWNKTGSNKRTTDDDRKNVKNNYTLVELEERTLELEKVVFENNNSKITVVNAGVMNAGKSSVFNALLGSKDLFKVKDIRTTIENSETEFATNTYFVDTPGLEAVNNDTDVAYEAYKKASVIVFVHSLHVGELHKNELEAINKIMSFFPNKQYFKNSFILVGTRKDMESEDGQFDIVLGKMKKDMSVHCKLNDFDYIAVSTTDYWEGVEAQDDDHIKYSGIEDLKEMIVEKLEKASVTNRELIESRIKKEKDILKANLEKHKKEKEKNVENVKAKYEKKRDMFEAKITSLQKKLNELASNC